VIAAVEILVRLTWLLAIVWGAWRLGVAALALPWRFRRHPQRFVGYLRDTFVANEPFILAFALVWVVAPLAETFGLARIAPLAGVGIGIVVVTLGPPIGAIRRAHARVAATRGAVR